jgi:hypothetical protein
MDEKFAIIIMEKSKYLPIKNKNISGRGRLKSRRLYLPTCSPDPASWNDQDFTGIQIQSRPT